MTTVSDDILRRLREDSEFRAEMRRELLTQELLDLPQRFAEYTQATDRRLDVLTENVNTLTLRLDALTQRVDDLTQRLDALIERVDDIDRRLIALTKTVDELAQSVREFKEATEKQFAIVIERLDRQHEMYRQQHEDMGRFRGNYAIDTAKRNEANIAGLIARLRGMRRLMMRSLSEIERNELVVMLEESDEEELGVSENIGLTFRAGDIIAEITERRSDERKFYLAVEASYTGQPRDVKRATDHAKLLRSVTGLDAYAVVAGIRAAPTIQNTVIYDAGEFVESRYENAVLWYQIREEDLDPLDPC